MLQHGRERFLARLRADIHTFHARQAKHTEQLTKVESSTVHLPILDHDWHQVDLIMVRSLKLDIGSFGAGDRRRTQGILVFGSDVRKKVGLEKYLQIIK